MKKFAFAALMSFCAAIPAFCAELEEEDDLADGGGLPALYGEAAPAAPFAPSVAVETLSQKDGKAEIALKMDLGDPALHLSGVSVAGGEQLGKDGLKWRVPAGAGLEIEINACSDDVCKNATVKLAWNAAAKAYRPEEKKESAEAGDGAAESAAALPKPLARPVFKKLDSATFKKYLEDFLEGAREESGNALADYSWPMILAIAFLGGLLMNFSPCVLPMMPVNLAIIGAGARAVDKGGVSRGAGAVRGAAYGLGITAAYGTLGVCAALGGMAFGDIQSSPWFNASIAVLFAALGLSLLDLFFIDFAKFASGGGGRKGSLVSAFAAGAVSAVLAGACVAPVLIFVLVYTADETAKGNPLAAGLPFVFALGMAAPWPVAGAGLKFLPKPGNWMNAVKKVFAVFVLGFAAWYGWLAYKGWTGARAEGSVVPAEFPAAYAQAAAKGKPVLVDCWATWCKNCAWVESNIFGDPAMAPVLEKFTVIKLQSEKLDELRAIPGFEDVDGLPAFRIFPPAPGGKAAAE